jgi:glutamate synthase (NADPH/NADH) small chain
LEKVKMPEQEPEVRNKNFEEVALGYTPEMAVEEALRCLGCKNMPCVEGCPVNVQIPKFIGEVADGRFEEAYQTVSATNALPAVCGRVCPQETQCEQLCVRGKKGESVAIGRLERFVADRHIQNVEKAPEAPASNGHKAAIVGAGPAGLTCAGDLARLGYGVVIFEAFHTAGGVLVYGIPEFRLPKAIVAKEVGALRKMGVEVRTNMVIGKVLSVDELFEMGYEAVFIGSGAGLPVFMNIEGESLLGVYSANEYLTRINLMRAYDDEYDTPLRRHRRVAVVGGGNVAMDAARSAKRLGAEDVYIVYRRSMTELPARIEEVHHAEEEGIVFHLLTNPVRILGDDNKFVRAVECVKMELGEPDDSGRRRPIEIKGSNYEIEVDAVIMAIGTSPNPLIRSTTKGLEANKWGCLVADERTMATTRDGVYAGGDAVTGAATVILAMGAGKTAAASIDKYVREKQ